MGYRFLSLCSPLDALTALASETPQPKSHRNPVALAREWQQRIDDGEVPSRAALARELGVTRAHVTQTLRLLQLAPSVQQTLLDLGDPIVGRQLGMHALRSMARKSLTEQEWKVSDLVASLL